MASRNKGFFLYKIVNSISDSIYIGITRTSLKNRFSSHKCSANRGIKTPLYDSIRSKGFDKFSIILIKEYDNIESLENAEYEIIKNLKDSNVKLYNILDGGVSYFPIKDMESHKINLRLKRKGRKPALGMKHSEDNKKLFSMFSKLRWDKYGRYPDDIILYSFKEAKFKFGISKTHYYRLLKLNKGGISGDGSNGKT